MKPEQACWPRYCRPILALPLFFSLACHDSSSGSSSNPSGGTGFLEIEARVNSSPPGSSVSENPVIRAVGSTLYVLYEDDRVGDEDQPYFNKSEDGGLTWLANDIRIPGSGLGVGDTDITRESLAADGSNVYVVFEENFFGADDIYVNASHDGGLTWQASATRLDPGTVGLEDSDEPRIHCDGDSAYVVWEDAIDGERDIYFARTTDGGATWSPCERLDRDAPGAARSSSPRIDTSGLDLYVVWEDSRHGASETYFQYSSDGGANWLAADVAVEARVGHGESTTDPQVLCRGQSVYVCWRDDREGDYDIYFQRSDDSGVTWMADDEKLNVAAAAGAEYPSMDEQGGILCVVWTATPAGASGDDVFTSVSHDAGVTWLAKEVPLDTKDRTGDSDDVHVCIVAQDIFVVWEDDRSGLDDIYMTCSADAGVTWMEEFSVERSAPGSADSSEPALACSSAGVWAVWHEDRDGELDVFVNGGMPRPEEEQAEQ